MSSEILVPFALSPSGGIAITQDPAVQTRQHVTALVSTTPGERVMLPTYGVDLSGQLFGDEAEVAAAVINDVATAMKTWEPSVTVRNISPVAGGSTGIGITQVEVDYVTPASDPATVVSTQSTATILPGGTVIEQVSP